MTATVIRLLSFRSGSRYAFELKDYNNGQKGRNLAIIFTVQAFSTKAFALARISLTRAGDAASL
jgi:hypothetical protein